MAVRASSQTSGQRVLSAGDAAFFVDEAKLEAWRKDTSWQKE